MAGLFRSHWYGPLEGARAVLLCAAGLSLRDVSERYNFTYASRESVGEWVRRLRLARSMVPMGIKETRDRILPRDVREQDREVV